MWHKASSAPNRPRLSTIATGHLNSSTSTLRHASSTPNFSEAITSIPVFDIDTILLYLSKLDESKYKKEKISLDSIKGGITGEYAKEKELVRQLFCDQLAYILEVLDNQKSKAPNATWASLFYQRSQKCQDILSSCKITHYLQLLKHYLRILRKKEAKEPNPTLATRIKIADNLLDFLQTHSTDLDSCLIGLPCSDESLKSMLRHVDPSSTNPSNPLNVTYQQLCSMIVEWGVGEDDAWMKEQMQKLCTTFRGVDKLEKGDVAVVASGPEDGTKSMIFGRYTGNKKSNNAQYEFFTTPEESKTEWVARRHIYPIPANMKEAIKNKAHLSKVVQDPANNFFKVLKENMKQQTEEFLIKSGVDSNIMKKVRDGSVELKDLPAVRNALNIVNKYHENPPEHFYKEMTFYAKALVSIHTRKMASIPTFTFFMTREATVSSIRNFANSPIAPSLLRTSLGLFQSAYDGLSVNVKELMFGSKKRKMTDWWLERIETAVQHFLVKRCFDFDAIPENYSMEPPQSIKSVKDNLAILEEILHAEAGTHMSPVPLVDGVTSEVYPVIDGFVKDSRIVICDALKLDINFEDATFNIASVEANFKVTKDQLTTQVAEQLKNLIGDLKYLEEMKRLEKARDGEKMSHIVPIGGLVMNQLIRQWNEHKTVVELWGHLDKPATPEPPSPTAGSSPLSPVFPLKPSRSMDSLSLDGITAAVEKVQSVPDIAALTDRPSTTTSSLAAAIAATFFIKTAASTGNSAPRDSILSPKLQHRDSEQAVKSSARDSPPPHKQRSNIETSHGRSSSDGTEELVHNFNVTRQINRSRSMNRNNSSIGITTLRGTRRQKEKEKEKEKELEQEDRAAKSIKLHNVVSEQRVEDVRHLLMDPTFVREVNTQDTDGWTPLHCCCHLGNLELCNLFLNVDSIDGSVKNKDGNTALHYVVRHAGSVAVIKKLLNKGADINAINSRSETPLHYACMRGHLDIITHLLENGANANAVNSDGDNALHYAIFTRSLETIKLLLKFGVYPDVCSRRQGTPLDIAIKNNIFDIAVELKNVIKLK